MNLKNVSVFGRRAQRAGHPNLADGIEEPIVTLGWACMVGTVLAAVLLAAYAAI